MEEDNKLVKGVFIEDPPSNAPDFIKKKISIRWVDFTAWLKTVQEDRAKDPNCGDYVKIDYLISRAGKPYLKINDFKPKPRPQEKEDSLPDFMS